MMSNSAVIITTTRVCISVSSDVKWYRSVSFMIAVMWLKETTQVRSDDFMQWEQ